MTAERDVLAGTMAELTWYEVQQAARDGAALLWAFGVIEQHGPHLPTGTDVYIPSARVREVRHLLAARGVPALVVPPYYWGVNVVSGSFPASYTVRPELMTEVIADLMAGFAKDGFRHVFCFTGHGDALHNLTVHAGIRAARERSALDASFVMEPELARRLGLAPDDPALTLHAAGSQAAFSSGTSTGTSTGTHLDVHAGRWETSMVQHLRPDLVREEARRALPSTDLGPADLAVWRRGHDDARRTTPLGYFGDPAAASADEGAHAHRLSAEQAATAIAERLGRG